jgi:two-component system CheB/CheR fusion protein
MPKQGGGASGVGSATPAAPCDRWKKMDRSERYSRILVVDDNMDAAWSVATLLQSSGFQVRVAANGADAVDQAVDMHAQAVLMDIAMSGMDGKEAATVLRDLYRPADLRLIALTGHCAIEDRNAVLAAGFDVFLPKPLVYEDLLQALKRD